MVYIFVVLDFVTEVVLAQAYVVDSVTDVTVLVLEMILVEVFVLLDSCAQDQGQYSIVAIDSGSTYGGRWNIVPGYSHRSVYNLLRRAVRVPHVHTVCTFAEGPGELNGTI